MLYADDAPLLALHFADGSYEAGEVGYAAPGDIGEVRLSGAGGVALSPDGALHAFAPGAARIVAGSGLLLEPASTNRLGTMHNAAPTTIAGWPLSPSRPAGSTATIVNDSTALYAAQDAATGAYIFRGLIDAGVMNGNVVRLYNPHPTDDWIILLSSTGAILTHSASAYVRCLSGGAQMTITNGGGSTVLPTTSAWQRIARPNMVASANSQVRFVVKAGSDVHVILAQLEPGSVVTSPIVTNGTGPIARAADTLEIVGHHLFGRPHTVAMEVEIGRQDGANRSFATIANAKGGEVTLFRGGDNSLSSTQSEGTERRPRFPNVVGPGRIRCGLRVGEDAWAIGLDGLLSHYPFYAPPAGLYRMIVGAAQDGSAPINGWVRSIEVHVDVCDDVMKAMVAAPTTGAAPLDLRRYVSPTGNDAADGKTPATAWQTLGSWLGAAIDGGPDRLPAVPLGTHLFLERGGVWEETARGVNYCTFGAYGTGDRPTIGVNQMTGFDENGQGVFRVEDIRVRDALFRGFNGFGIGGWMFWDVSFFRCGRPNISGALSVAGRGSSRANYGDAFPTNGATTDFLMMLCRVEESEGTNDGDCLYLEAIQGRIKVKGNWFGAAKGAAADDVQAGRSTDRYVQNPAHGVISHNYMETGSGASGKGALVTIMGSCIIESNEIVGTAQTNFGISIASSDTICRRNRVKSARRFPYSFLIAISTNEAVARVEIYENILEDGNRALASTGTGMPPRTDIIIRDNVVINSLYAIYVDRPTSGRIYGIKGIACTHLQFIAPGLSVPAGDLYDDFFSGYHLEMAA